MKILIADDHALFRDGLSMNLEKLEPSAVISQAANFTQSLKIAASEPEIDLIVIDLDMPDMSWEEGIRQLREASPSARIVVISASDESRNVKKALELGAVGYISKQTDTQVLNSALKLIIDGGTYLPPSAIEKRTTAEISGRRANGKHLTARQAEVLSYVAEGMSNKQIAYEMGVSEATVKLHINALLRAVGATNRTQAVVLAQKMGII